MKINPENLLKVWKNKGQILEGIVNKVFKQEHIEEISRERMEICKSNICGLYDSDGSSEKAVVQGQPACAGCGCSLEYKTRCLSCHCYLQDAGGDPLWSAVLSDVEETLLKERMTQDDAQADSAS
jgi:hypothetical protein